MVERILMTADTVGGVFTYALTLASELGRHGVSVHLATMGAEVRPEQRAAAAAIPRLVLHESTYALEWMDDPWEDVDRAGRWLLALERNVRPDIVHLNGYAHGALRFAAPTVVVAHSCVLSWWEAVYREPAPPRYDRYQGAVRAGLDGADAVVAISRAMRHALVRHYDVGRRPRVIHNGAFRANSNRTKEAFVLSCGRLWDRAKNVEALARVAPCLSWPVKVAGWGRELPGVEWFGWLGSQALGELMERAAIFALPARYEPFGLSVLEAGLRGCALVLGDIPSMREIWGNAALFVEDDDSLVAAIESLARDPRLLAEFGDRARARARCYDAGRMAKAMLALYSECQLGVRSCA